MKKVILFLFLSGCVGLNAQMTAPDWTHADCGSASHTLYTYLDSQEVVVMEFVMGCGSCTNAGNLLMLLKDQYDISHPGKVNFFLMDYYPSNTCTDVNTTWSSYNFDAYFDGCWNEKEAYYPTLYPMPAIVIAAGSFHTVIYNDLSWQSSDTTLIKQAIDQFFNSVGMEEEISDELLIYPNPTTEKLFVNLGAEEISGIEVLDMLGRTHTAGYTMDNGVLVVDVEDLPSGQYILVVSGSKILRSTFVRN